MPHSRLHIKPIRCRYGKRRAFTLIEIVLVLGIILVITAMTAPSFFRQMKEAELPNSARQLRSLVTLVRANAAFDGMRYRIRFPEDDEEDPLGGDRQPLIEREDDPIEEPDTFNLVTAPWAVGRTILGDVWCAEVWLERPTIERMQDRRDTIRDAMEEALEDFSVERPPLVIEPDGSSDWASMILIKSPRDIGPDEFENYPRIELIMDGATGLAWLQRPFYDEELDLFEEKNWPAVLRQDFLDPRVLGEDDVLELRDFSVR